MPPGLEMQIDYGKVGTFYDPLTKKNRTLYAFCAILSYSRLPFIYFCFSQNQESFVDAHVRCFNFIEGVPQYLSIDNLKAGVIKPEIYDPKINKSYNDMTSYYNVFVNPCRVRRPTDKGKIERLVPSARELFRMLKNIHPNKSLTFLNEKALEWCKNEYGKKKHGTTGYAPLSLFMEKEHCELKKLPEKAFVIPKWKNVKVHPDQFFEFEKKYYSLPAFYKGKSLWVKKTDGCIQIYDNFKLIRMYIISMNKRNYYAEDFPKVVREMMNGGYPKYILDKSKELGNDAYNLIEKVLQPHAFLNARRAMGML